MDNMESLLVGPGIIDKDLALYFATHRIDATDTIFDAGALCPEILEIDDSSGQIFTPHFGEALFMFDEEKKDINEYLAFIQNKINDFQIVILKGPSTFIITKNMIYVMDRGPNLLATAGTGDVLSGILVSLLSQGYSRLETSILGTYLHAEAANYYMNNISKDGMTASDLIDCIPYAFNSLRNNE